MRYFVSPIIILSMAITTGATALGAGHVLCESAFKVTRDSTSSNFISEEELASIGLLRARKRRLPQVGAAQKTVYRGLSGSILDFDPIAREFRENRDDLWTSSDRREATQYALHGRDLTRKTGYLLELKFPSSIASKRSSDVIAVSRIPNQDLLPYISRIGVISFNFRDFQQRVSVHDRTDLKRIKTEIWKLAKLKSRWGSSQKEMIELNVISLQDVDLDMLNSVLIKESLAHRLLNDDPDFIRWFEI